MVILAIVALAAALAALVSVLVANARKPTAPPSVAEPSWREDYLPGPLSAEPGLGQEAAGPLAEPAEVDAANRESLDKRRQAAAAGPLFPACRASRRAGLA
jgi:hypothetical protein